MKKIIVIVFIFSIFINMQYFDTAAAGKTYYVDYVNGDDNNDGASEAAPFRTAQKIMSMTLETRDTVLFKRGQRFNGVEIALNSEEMEEQPSNITFGAYGEGERPVLSGGVYVSGWELFKGTTYKAASPRNEMVYLIKADDKLVRYANSIIVQGGKRVVDVQNCDPDMVPENKYIWKDGYIYYNSPDKSPNDKQMEVQASHYIISVVSPHYQYKYKYITVKDLNLTMSGGASIYFATVEYITVSNNELSFAESGYSDGSGIHAGSCRQSSTFSDNIIHDVFGDGILLWNTADTTLLRNHITGIYVGKNDGGDGIQSSGTVGGTNASNNKVIDNYISMEGSDSPKGCIQQERGNNIVITGNTCLYGYYGIGSTVNNNGAIENNYLAYQGIGLTVNNWSAGILISDAADSQNVKVKNNIVYGSLPFGIFITHIITNNVYHNRKNYEISGNTCYNTGIPFRSQVPLSGEIKNNVFWTEELYKKEYADLEMNSLTVPRVMTISKLVENEGLTLDNNIIGPENPSVPSDSKIWGYINYLGTTYKTMESFSDGTAQNINGSSKKLSDVKVFIDDRLITGNTYIKPEDNIGAEFDILKGYDNGRISLILAIEKDNSLVYADMHEFSYEFGKRYSISIPYSIVSNYEGCKIKAFIWDYNSQKPLSEARIVNSR